MSDEAKYQLEQQMLESIENDEDEEWPMAQCPICLEVSPGARDCGCFAELHYGKD